MMIINFTITKYTMIFKINISKLVNKSPELLKSWLSLSFLKILIKNIKEICKEFK